MPLEVLSCLPQDRELLHAQRQVAEGPRDHPLLGDCRELRPLAKLVLVYYGLEQRDREQDIVVMRRY